MVNAGPNHYIANNIQVPYPGTWKLELSATDNTGSTIRLAVDIKITT
jgi:hypothetical protein